MQSIYKMGKEKIVMGGLFALGGVMFTVGTLIGAFGASNDADVFRSTFALVSLGLLFINFGLMFIKTYYAFGLLLLLSGILFAVMAGYTSTVDKNGVHYVAESATLGLGITAGLLLLGALIFLIVTIYFKL